MEQFDFKCLRFTFMSNGQERKRNFNSDGTS